MTFRAERVWVTGEEFPYTSSQVKRAGDRIRRARSNSVEPAAADLELLDLYRSSHYPALRQVQDRLVRVFHKKVRVDPQKVPIVARPLKTPEAIIAKLVREQGRLNRIQDIAGARVVVPTREIQDAAVAVIANMLKGLRPVIAKDCRDEPDEHGYRAVHVVVTTVHVGLGERSAEVQIRTQGQNAWAQVVESLDGALGSDLKHGDGPADFMEWLLALSAAIRAAERGEHVTMDALPPMPEMPSQ